LIWWDKTPGQTDIADSDGDQEKTRLDGYIISAAFSKQQIGKEEYICGNPAHESLYQEMALMQATIEDSTWDDKIVENHLSFIIPAVDRYHKIPLCVKLALATKAGVFLRYLNSPWPSTAGAEFLPWDAAHGTARIKTFFFQWPAARVLFDVLESTGLQLTVEAVRCLGSGNLGCVFPVREHADSPQMALKVVVGAGKASKLRDEFEINQQVAASAPHAAFVKATRFSRATASIASGGAGMLMEEVGEPVAPKDHRNLARALHALSDLHRAGFTHGSARLDNLVECGGRLKWCDLQRAKRMHGGLSTENTLYFLMTSPGHEILRDVTALVDSWGRESMSRMVKPAVIAYVDGHWSVDAALKFLLMFEDCASEEEQDSAATLAQAPGMKEEGNDVSCVYM
jgi:hypothetical protein